jgi:hypothetical protein
MNLVLRRAANWGILAALFLVSLSAIGQEPKPAAPEQTVSFWMRKKLEFSQAILGAITTADYEKIEENGKAMHKLSRVEGFIRRQTPGYQTQLRIFDESAAEIIRQAQRQNVDGAALAFTQMTISCVNCHKRLREGE